MSADSFTMSRRRAGAAIGGALLPGLAGAAAPGVSEREIVIGQSITLQGGRNDYGVAALDGVKLALDRANAAGGVAGRRIVLRTLDDENNPSKAAQNAQRLVAEGAFILFGSLEGGPSTAVATVAADSRVPLFGPMAGSPNLRRPHQDLVFPVRAEHRDEFRALIAYGRTLGLTTLAFFHADSDVGRTHLANVQALAREAGLQLVLALPFKSSLDDAGLDAMAAEIARAGPGLCFNHGSASLYGRLVARVKRAGGRTLMMAVNSGSTEMARTLGPLAHGMVFTQVVPSPWERKHAITREYRAAAEAAPGSVPPGYGALEGFVTAKALVLALQAAGRTLTREGFVAALQDASFDLGGLRLRYRRGDHEGSRFVDLALFSREGRFLH